MHTLYVPRMFVEHLIATLVSPLGSPLSRWDRWQLPVDRYRGQLTQKACALSASGELDAETTSWVLRCVAEGWLDAYLSDLRDGLLELGAASLDAARLERLLELATERMVRSGAEAAAAAGEAQTPELLLLQTVLERQQAGGAPGTELGLRSLARRYALELGLLEEDPGQGGQLVRTPLGEVAVALPRHLLRTFLVALEVLQSFGAQDRWRTPRAALLATTLQPTFAVATTASARMTHDPQGYFPWQRVRRLHLLGLCEPAAPCLGGQDAGAEVYEYRLTVQGQQAVAQVLAEPPSDLVLLAAGLVTRATQRTTDQVELRLRAQLLETGAKSDVAHGPKPSAPTAELGALGEGAIEGGTGSLTAGLAAAWEADSYPALPPTGRAPSPSGGVHWQVAGPLTSLPAPLDAMTTAVGLQAAMLPDSGGAAGSGPVLQELDLTQLIRRAWEELRVSRVHFTLLGPSVTTRGDRRIMLQTWREILRAAADAALQGGHQPPLVSVELDLTHDATLIRVDDNGRLRDAWGALQPRLSGASVTLLPPRLGGTTLQVTLKGASAAVASAA